MTQRMQIVPIEGFRLFGALVKKEIELSRTRKGTFIRTGTKVRNRAKWGHKNYVGRINLERSAGEVVTVEIHSRQQGGENWQLLHAFVGFIVRHFADEIEAIHIHLPKPQTR